MLCVEKSWSILNNVPTFPSLFMFSYNSTFTTINRPEPVVNLPGGVEVTRQLIFGTKSCCLWITQERFNPIDVSIQTLFLSVRSLFNIFWRFLHIFVQSLHLSLFLPKVDLDWGWSKVSWEYKRKELPPSDLKILRDRQSVTDTLGVSPF